MKERFVKKEVVFCPLCGDEHLVDLMERDCEFESIGEKIPYTEIFYRCPHNTQKGNGFFHTQETFRESLDRLENVYRKVL